jgi:hypothetical protein
MPAGQKADATSKEWHKTVQRDVLWVRNEDRNTLGPDTSRGSSEGQGLAGTFSQGGYMDQLPYSPGSRHVFTASVLQSKLCAVGVYCSFLAPSCMCRYPDHASTAAHRTHLGIQVVAGWGQQLWVPVSSICRTTSKDRRNTSGTLAKAKHRTPWAAAAQGNLDSLAHLHQLSSLPAPHRPLSSCSGLQWRPGTPGWCRT